MRRSTWALGVAPALVLGFLVLASPQTGDQSNCQTQVHALYSALSSAGILPATPGLTPGQQLTALSKELRLTVTQLGLERQQVFQLKRSLAEVAEQSREWQERVQQLSQAVEQVKTGKDEAPKN